MSRPIIDRRRRAARRDTGQRRRYPRVRLPFDGVYESPERVLTARQGGNLNFRGVFVPTPVPDGIGAQAVFRLRLDDGLAMLKLAGRVVWSNTDRQRGPRGMGLRFEALHPWQIKRIAAALLRSGGLGVLPQLTMDGRS